MASLRERMKRLERQSECSGLTVSTREPGGAKYYKTIHNGDVIEIAEAEYKRRAKSARPTEIAFNFAEEQGAP